MAYATVGVKAVISGMSEFKRDADDFVRALGRMGGAVREETSGSSGLSAVFSSIGSSILRVAEIAGGFLLSHVLMGAIDQFTKLATEAINATAMIQAFEVSLEALAARDLLMQASLDGIIDGTVSVSEVMPEATKKSRELMKTLTNMAILSPYRLENVVSSFRQAMAFGFPADEATKFTEAILNVAAGTGATSDRLERMAYNLAQVRIQGKVTALDVRQLALAGFDLLGVLKYIGKQMGIQITDIASFNTALAQGKITWEDFTEYFAKYANDVFGGASERMARTLAGLASTFNDVFVVTLPAIIGPAVRHVVEILNSLLNTFLVIRETGALTDLGVILGRLIPTPAWSKRLSETTKNLRDIFEVLNNKDKYAPIVVEEAIWELEQFRLKGGLARGIIMDVFGDRAVGYFDRFKDAIVEVRKAAERLYEPLKGMFGQFDFYVVIDAAVRSMEWFGRALTFIADTVDALKSPTAFKDFVESLAIPDWAKDSLVSTYNVIIGISRAVEDIVNRLQAGESVRSILESFGVPDWVLTSFDNLKGALDNFKKFWDENGEGILSALGDIVAALFGTAGESAGTLIAGGSVGLTGMIKEFSDTLVENGPKIVSKLREIADFLENEFKPAVKRVVDYITTEGWAKLREVFDYLIAHPEIATILVGVLGLISRIDLVSAGGGGGGGGLGTLSELFLIIASLKDAEGIGPLTKLFTLLGGPGLATTAGTLTPLFTAIAVAGGVAATLALMFATMAAFVGLEEIKAPGTFFDWASRMKEVAFDEITESLDRFRKVWDDLKTTLETTKNLPGMDAILGFLGGITDRFIALESTRGYAIFTGIVQLITKLATTPIDTLTIVLDTVTNFLENFNTLWTDLSEGDLNIGALLGMLFPVGGEDTDAVVGEWLTDFEFGEAFKDWIESSLAPHQPEIAQAISDLISGALAAANNLIIVQMVEFGGSLWRALTFGLLQVDPSTGDSSGSIAFAIADAVRGGLDQLNSLKGEFVNKGADLMEGLAQGISSKTQFVIDIVANIVQSIIDAWATLTKSQSPSKLSMGWGSDLMEGLRLGIEKASSSISTELGNVVKYQVQASPLAQAAPAVAAPSVFSGSGGSTITKNYGAINIYPQTVPSLNDLLAMTEV